MDGYGLTIALLVTLVAINALFAGSEIALISLREGQLRQLERRGSTTATTLVRLTRDPNRFLATIQIGITLAGFLASATAAVSLAGLLARVLGFLGNAAEPVSVALTTLALAFATLVFGELAPKRLAMQHSMRWALLVARPLDMLSLITRPVVWTLSAATNVVVLLFGGNPHATKEQLSRGELHDLVSAHTGLNPEQRAIILGALEIHERMLREVLVPRRSVFTLSPELSAVEARSALVDAGHSCAPVARHNELDDTVGVVRLRDLVDDERALSEIAHPATVFPETVRVSDALRRFREEHEQFALVIDEYGSVEGIVTLEDLLEEIVGEIYDDTDRDVVAVVREADGSLSLAGTFPLHDLTDVGVELPAGTRKDQATIAGLVLAVLGRVPRSTGDRVRIGGWTVEVTGIDGNAITHVRLRQNGPS